MISRQWAGVLKAKHAEEYMQHLKEELFPKLSSISGFCGASILRKDMEDAVEFLIITNWESMEAIRKFAGENPDLAVVPEEVQRMALQYDKQVRHYEVAYSYPDK
ncbi:antibiotic biosynthesis monooxygenase family protein [Pontibacter toksunensis]|uniref:Antibiotic biosynthesis monooxygenase family protein n=1 Tax=Pontibacter toksunensis TaxID=1332631 RepID=A0ABW6BMX3_9BACT